LQALAKNENVLKQNISYGKNEKRGEYGEYKTYE